MDIKSIIVGDYLESLKESEELDYLFPLFLESQGFVILSKPTESKGLSQYGKDVVAVGCDFDDGIKKRFYFEIKGGEDRDITNSTYTKTDGIRESLIESKDKSFEFTNKEYEKLPLKIVLVHNGEIKESVRATFEGFINKEFPTTGNIEFDRWGLSKLTGLFAEKFFSEFLLTDKDVTRLFNKTLLNLDVEDKVSANFIKLLDVIFDKGTREKHNKTLPRKWKMMFESMRLISFIIYTESKEYNNLNIAKKYLTHLVVRLWYWILKNKLEQNKEVIKYVDKIIDFYLLVMAEYFQRTLPIAYIKDGLCSETGGRYEQVGYTMRTFDYLQYLCWFLRLSPLETHKQSIREILVNVLNANKVSSRALLDIHSIPIIEILKILIETGDNESAKNYLSEVLFFIRLGKEKHDRLPDANNSEKNVIKLIATKEKSIYYSDSTSPLLTVLMEFIVILDMQEEYYLTRDFIYKHKIDLGIFIPHHGINSTSKHLIEDKESDLEEQIFSKNFFNDGYQSGITLHKNFDEDLSFDEFKEMMLSQKDEFTYEYRTDKAGFSFLKDLAHIYFNTPYFPDKWKCLLNGTGL
jgi:hypothetical protein